MFSPRKSINLINRIHERSLVRVCYDTRSAFQEPLQLSKSVCVHYKNIQILTTEVCKIVNNICPLTMKLFFSFVENKYNLENSQEIEQQ